MKSYEDQLLIAAAQAGITPEQARTFLNRMENSTGIAISKFDLSPSLYYLGAMIVLLAMGTFLGSMGEKFGGEGMLFISLMYAGGFLLLGNKLWQTKDLKVSGGLFITLAVCMVPVAIFGLEKITGFEISLPYPGALGFMFGSQNRWFLMEIGTILAGIIAFRYYQFSFLMAPIFFALWLIAIDTPSQLFGRTYSYSEQLWMSAGLGAIILKISFFIDQRTKEDLSFWGYLFGLMAFWGSLTLMNVDSNMEIQRALYCLINVVLVFVSILLNRRSFIVFGSLGIMLYLLSLFYRHFYDSTAFPFILSLLGIGIIYLGIFYQKNHLKIESFLIHLLPLSIKKWLPINRK